MELAAAGFAALWDGRTVRPADLDPGPADVLADAVSALAALAAQGRCELDEHGSLVGIHGLTLRSTRHHFVHKGRTHHTWCAFDSIGIPAALRLDAVAHTDCRTCHRPLQLTIVDGVPEDIAGAVLWLPALRGNHLIEDFCGRADLYCSIDHLRRQVDTLTTLGQHMRIETAAAKGRETWADVASRDETRSK